MADINEIARLREEIRQLKYDVEALERRLSSLSPEDLAQIQVHLAVLENTLINLKSHIDTRQRDLEDDIKRLDKDKVAKSEAKIPHLIIYAMGGSALAAVLYALFERIGLHLP